MIEIIRRGSIRYFQALNIPGGIERYLAALRFALELTCEKGYEKERRINCLKMSAHVALALSQEGMHEPLQLLVDFCVDVSFNSFSINAFTELNFSCNCSIHLNS